MKQETTEALQSLEKELGRLRAAVDHIEQAKSVAQKVLVAVAGVQKKYSEHLDALLGLHKGALEQVGTDSQARFDELGTAARRHILETAARAKKQFEEHHAEVLRTLEGTSQRSADTLSQLSVRAEQLFDQSTDAMKQLVRDSATMADGQLAVMTEKVKKLAAELDGSFHRVVEDSAQLLHEQIRKGGDASVRHIEDFTGSARSQVLELGARAHKHIEELGGKATSRLEELQDLVHHGMQTAIEDAKRSLEEANAQSIKIFAAIKKTYDQQALDFEKLSAGTDAIIASSGKLSRSIEAVDFPEKLKSIMADIRSLHFNLNSAMNRVDALDKSLESSLREFADDVVGKLSRLEMFIEKGLRTFEEATEKEFSLQRESIGRNRTFLAVILALNVLLLMGVYVIWSGSDKPSTTRQPIIQRQVVHDTVYLPQEEPKKPRGRR
ncbi:MAG: hypothetical protein M5R41_19500 [Bacteroidia bacterium]|nr:hypothetical protein [Bacteroidia bacterium]